MDSLTAAWTLPIGLLVGGLCGGFVIRWLALFMAAIGKATPKESPPIRGRSIAPILLATLFHPVPWLLLVGIPYGVMQLLATRPRAEWIWFIAGVALYFPIVGGTVYVALRRRRRLRSGIKP